MRLHPVFEDRDRLGLIILDNLPGIFRRHPGGNAPSDGHQNAASMKVEQLSIGTEQSLAQPWKVSQTGLSPHGYIHPVEDLFSQI